MSKALQEKDWLKYESQQGAFYLFTQEIIPNQLYNFCRLN